MIERLRLVIRTPHEIVLDEFVEAVRVPTETGQAGLRPRGEAVLLAVEPGLILRRSSGNVRFAATAGGLCEGDREGVILYTPFAVLGDDADEVIAELDRALATPDSEIAARRRLGELEERIVAEVHQRPPVLRTRKNHG